MLKQQSSFHCHLQQDQTYSTIISYFHWCSQIFWWAGLLTFLPHSPQMWQTWVLQHIAGILALHFSLQEGLLTYLITCEPRLLLIHSSKIKKDHTMWCFYRWTECWFWWACHNSDVLFPELKFLYFATVTGKSWCGGVQLFGSHARSVKAPYQINWETRNLGGISSLIMYCQIIKVRSCNELM